MKIILTAIMALILFGSLSLIYIKGKRKSEEMYLLMQLVVFNIMAIKKGHKNFIDYYKAEHGEDYTHNVISNLNNTFWDYFHKFRTFNFLVEVEGLTNTILREI